MGRRHHVLDVYDAELHLATTPRQWDALVRRFDGGLEPDDCNGVGTTTLVLDRERFVPHLVAAHVATMLLDHVRESYDGESEALAYLVGWVTRWLIEGVGWKH